MDTDTNFKALWAQRLVRQKLAVEINAIDWNKHKRANSLLSTYAISNVETPWTPDNLPPDRNFGGGFLGGPGGGDEYVGHPGGPDVPKEPSEMPHRKVCIVGAGLAGLYIAMILDSLKISNLTYDILEASPRVGGRVYTHHFTNKIHDYYDIGAMRYPDIPSMQRTFDLFRRTGIDTHKIPYYLDGLNTPDMFNDRFFSKDDPDPYHVSESNNGTVPDHVVKDVKGILDAAFGPYKKALAEDFKEGYKKLMKVDDFSTREFLKRGGPDGTLTKYDFFSIQWMETQNTSTNLFDQAFSESVMDSFDFDYPNKGDAPVGEGDAPPVKWYCIEGGTGRLIDAMEAKVKTTVQTSRRVEAISIDWDSNIDGNMSVKCAGETNPRTGYSTVFNTTTLACLDRMDLRTLELHPVQKDAIRSLHYDNSVKVAIKFSRPWWITDCNITQGGVASTDRPLRTCVYPSYNLTDDPNKPAVLLASYTWAQDATRMASLTNRASPTGEDELIDLILHDLARLHAGTVGTDGKPKFPYSTLKELYLTHHAYSWSDDPCTGGAFALFAPGQYSKFYPHLTRPAADSKFHIVGEASSMHHAWVVGALDSAHAAVFRFLYRFEMWYELWDLIGQWGMPKEIEAGEHGTAHLQLLLGRLREGEQWKVVQGDSTAA
jgi:monoamine oxidase